MKKVRKMVSPKEFAELRGLAYSTVMSWIRAGLLKGVVTHTKPLLWYELPANAALPVTRAARKKK
jgi:predicted site-specific integrase-resolvase